MRPPILALAFLLTLAGCGSGGREPAPEKATMGEAKALEDAGAMLEERRSADPPPPAPATKE